MHFMPDTEEQDSAEEAFWPEGYKQVIARDVREVIGAHFNNDKRLRHIYQPYSAEYRDPAQFAGKIADMVTIGAENGADDAFDEVIAAFVAESPLPEERRYARYLWPSVLPAGVKNKLRQVIIDEYRQDDIYNYAYKAGYQTDYHHLDEFIDRIAQLVVTGTVNGADDMLEAIYRSLLVASPLPPARRRPRRLKRW